MELNIVRSELIKCLRLGGFRVPNSAKIEAFGEEHLTMEFDETFEAKKFLVTHDSIKEERTSEQVNSEEETTDWVRHDLGFYTRVVIADNEREANRVAGPLPTS